MDKYSVINGILIGVMSATMFMIVCGDSSIREDAYKQMHKGVVKCIDTPDKSVYCYQTDSNKGE